MRRNPESKSAAILVPQCSRTLRLRFPHSRIVFTILLTHEQFCLPWRASSATFSLFLSGGPGATLTLKDPYARALALLAGVFVSSCEKAEPLRELTIEGVRYVFPGEMVAGLYDDKVENDDYIRVNTPNRYQVVYSLRAFRPNEQGGDVPTITHINDDPNNKAEVIPTKSGVVICTPTKLRLDCGIRLIDKGIVWSVLFDRQDIANIEAIMKEARATLASARR